MAAAVAGSEQGRFSVFMTAAVKRRVVLAFHGLCMGFLGIRDL